MSRKALMKLGIVDNDTFSLAALSSYIAKKAPHLTIFWQVVDPVKALELCKSSDTVPDVALVDMSMPNIDGLTVTRKIRERDARTVIIAMTSFPLTDYASDAAAAGAQAIVSKAAPASITSLLELVAAGQTVPVISTSTTATTMGMQAVAETRFDSPRDSYLRLASAKPIGIEKLTDLEKTITELVKEGMTSAEVAERIHMNPMTVNTHLKRACEKMGARNRVQLVGMWVEQSGPRR